MLMRRIIDAAACDRDSHVRSRACDSSGVVVTLQRSRSSFLIDEAEDQPCMKSGLTTKERGQIESVLDLLRTHQTLLICFTSPCSLS
jgi:hypothetical protein